MSNPTYMEELIDQVQVLLDHIMESYERLQVEAVTDFGTGVYNRRYFLRRLAEELERGQRYDEVFSLIILDFDNFKQYNDTRGHVEGDRLLRSYARLMEQRLRTPDFIARYGGDEFVILLPGTDEQGTLRVANRLLKIVERFDPGTPTMSMGASTYPTHGSSAQELIRRADAALYVAKQLGKNRAITASDRRVTDVLSEHYGTSSQLAAHTAQIPNLGGGTPIDSTPMVKARRDSIAVTDDACEVTEPRQPKITKQRPNRERLTRTSGYNNSHPIAVGHSGTQQSPSCFWVDNNYYRIEHITPADIVSATGIDSYYVADTPEGRYILRRRGTNWFMEGEAPNYAGPSTNYYSA